VARHGSTSVAKVASHAGLLLLVAGAPLAIGCVHPPAIVAAGGVAALAFAAMLLRRGETERQVRVPALGWVLLAVTAYTAFQCVPLPSHILELIAPANHRLFVDTLGDLGLYGPGSWRPLSLDPPATLWETLKIAILTTTFLLAANIEEHTDRRGLLLLVIGATGVVMMVVGVAQTTAGTTKIYGLFQPWSTGRPAGVVFTTFVNPNHNAAFLTVATACWVGLAAATHDPSRRVMAGLGAAVCSAGVFLSISRGGIVALAVGLMLLVALLLKLRRGDEPASSRAPRRGWRPSARLWLPLVLAASLGTGLWLGWEPVTHKFSLIDVNREREAGRPKVWRDALPMLRAHAVLGVGRGAFATSYPRYQRESKPGAYEYAYSHLENEYLQLPVDLGLAVGGGLLLAIGIAAFGWIRRTIRAPHLAAGLAALAALAVHAFTDFNLETLGVAVPAAALAGMLAGSTPAGALTQGRIPRRTSRWVVAPLPLAILVLAVLADTSHGTWSERDAERLTAAARRVALPELTKRAEAAVRRHPADYLQYAVMGAALANHHDLTAIRWLNRAMFLRPTHRGPHLIAARALRAAGRRGQALVEYRLALSGQLSARERVLGEIVAAYARTEDLIAGVPETAAGYGELTAALRAANRSRQAEEVARRGFDRWPQDPTLLHQLASLSLARKDLAAAEWWARALLAVEDTPRSWITLGTVLSAAGRQQEALAHYEVARARHPTEIEILVGVSSAYVAARRFDDARRAAEAIGNLPSVNVAALATMHDQLAVIDEADGRTHRAAWERGQARRLRGGP
jgi:tetratricopeptide (TPR) repeat protein